MTRSASDEALAGGFRSIQRMPAAAGEVINTIKEMILQGKLAPLQRLPSEKDLAEALGVSRPTVREAVRGLMTLNIVESRRGDGTYLTSLEPALLAAPIDFLLRVDEGGLAALTEARVALESGIAEVAAARATSDGIDRLQELAVAYAASKNDIDRCIELDLAFHRELAATAQSPILASLVVTMAALGVKSRAHTAQSGRMRAAAHDDYAAIIDAVAAHDPMAARAAMITHLAHVQASVADEMNREPIPKP